MEMTPQQKLLGQLAIDSSRLHPIVAELMNKVLVLEASVAELKRGMNGQGI